MSVYIQMTESSFWTTNSLLLLDASLTERNFFFFKLYDGLRWPNLTQSDFFALAIVNHICWHNVGKTL